MFAFLFECTFSFISGLKMPTREDWDKLREAICRKNLYNLTQLAPRFSPADINKLFSDDIIFLCFGKCTPLTYSILVGCSVPFVQHLVREMGANPDKPNGDGMSPLAMAVKWDELELLLLLLELNADPNMKLNNDWWGVKL